MDRAPAGKAAVPVYCDSGGAARRWTVSGRLPEGFAASQLGRER